MPHSSESRISKRKRALRFSDTRRISGSPPFDLTWPLSPFAMLLLYGRELARDRRGRRGAAREGRRDGEMEGWRECILVPSVSLSLRLSVPLPAAGRPRHLPFPRPPPPATVSPPSPLATPYSRRFGNGTSPATTGPCARLPGAYPPLGP